MGTWVSLSQIRHYLGQEEKVVVDDALEVLQGFAFLITEFARVSEPVGSYYAGGGPWRMRIKYTLDRDVLYRDLDENYGERNWYDLSRVRKTRFLEINKEQKASGTNTIEVLGEGIDYALRDEGPEVVARVAKFAKAVSDILLGVQGISIFDNLWR